MKDNKFKIVVPFYNVEKWIGNCIKSLQLQTYNDFICYLVDDISTDSTADKVTSIIKNDSRFVLIKNKQKKFALQNIYDAIKMSGDDSEDVIVTLDGDDWLASKKALEILNDKYKEHNCLMTYGSYIEYPSMQKGKFCRQISSQTIKNNAYRSSQWFSSHLRTFKRQLWDRIKKEDLLQDDKKFYRMTWDMAFMFPMLEMAGPMALHISDTLYCYNRENPLNDDKVNHQLQLSTESEIRKKQKYKQHFVSCNILGPLGDISGLGNQLFCIATALSYALEHKKSPYFHQIETDRHIKKFKNNLYKNLPCGIGEDIFHHNYNEINFHYNPIPVAEKNIKLNGYFQSHKYFAKHRDEIISILDVINLQNQINQKYGNYSDYTSIHIRRGDYLKLSEYHHNLTLNYFEQAVNRFDKEEKFLVFSNDIAWCKENLNFIKNVEFSENKEDWEDLILMSTCKNNIMANSTFSWWGAWLNTNKDKRVIAPKKWFGSKFADKDTKDIIPENWERL